MKILKDVLRFWKETWAENRIIFFLEAIGSITSITAGSILAFSQVPNLMVVFVFYLTGSACLMFICYYRQSSWMLVMFTFFTMMNVIGLINHYQV